MVQGSVGSPGVFQLFYEVSMLEIMLHVLCPWFCGVFCIAGASCVDSKLTVPQVQCGHVSNASGLYWGVQVSERL